MKEIPEVEKKKRLELHSPRERGLKGSGDPVLMEVESVTFPARAGVESGNLGLFCPDDVVTFPARAGVERNYESVVMALTDVTFPARAGVES